METSKLIPKKAFPRYIEIKEFKDVKLLRKQRIFQSPVIGGLKIELGMGRGKFKALKELKNMTKFKSLRRFKYSGFSIGKEEIDSLIALLTKLHPREVTSLNLALEQSYECSDKHVEPLSKLVGRFANLTSLEFMIYNFYVVEGNFLKILQESLKTLNYVQHLKIQTQLCDNFKEIGLQNMLTIFDSLNQRQITSLHVDIGSMRQDISEFLPALLNKLKDYPILKRLWLNISDNVISEESFKTSVALLSKLSKLENLGFSSTSPDSLPDSYQEAVMKGLINLTNLSSLYMNFYTISKLSLEGLSEVLLQVKGLKEFKLCIAYLVSSDLFCQKITSRENEVDNQTFSKFCKSLNTHSASLENFCLSFSELSGYNLGCPQFNSNKSFVDLATTLSNFTQINQFILYFPDQINQKNFKILSNAIKKMKDLRTLFLNIKGVGFISDEAFTSFSEIFTSVENLENAFLSFTDFKGLTNKGLSNLANTLREKDSLKRLELQIVDSFMLTKSSLSFFIETLKNLKNFEKGEISITFENHPEPKRKNKEQEEEEDLEEQPVFSIRRHTRDEDDEKERPLRNNVGSVVVDSNAKKFIVAQRTNFRFSRELMNKLRL